MLNYKKLTAIFLLGLWFVCEVGWQRPPAAQPASQDVEEALDAYEKVFDVPSWPETGRSPYLRPGPGRADPELFWPGPGPDDDLLFQPGESSDIPRVGRRATGFSDRSFDSAADRSRRETLMPRAAEPPDQALGQQAQPSPTQEQLPDDIVIDVLNLKNMDIVDVLKLISEKSNLNIIAGRDIGGQVSIYLKDVRVRDALRIILDSNGLAYRMEDGIIQVMSAAEYEARYGIKFGGDIQTQIQHLVHADTEDTKTLLTELKSPAGKIISDSKSRTLVLMDTPEKLRVMADLIRRIDVAVHTEMFDLNYSQAQDVADKIQEILTPDIGQVRYDERSNRLVVTDALSNMEKIKQVIRAFDIKEKQVLIEAKILQVVLSKQHKFGIDWEGIVKDYHNLGLKSDFDILSATSKRGSLSIGTVSSDEYTFLVEALQTEGISNILSSPSITAINNQEAKILIGSSEPYVTTTTTTTASGPTTTSESVNFIEVGVKLYVTPTIHKDDFVTLKIRPEVSSVTSTITTGNNNTVPVVDTSEAETTVLVKDGVTIVIGGLIKEEEIDSVNKVPLLGDIPLLGNAFRNKDKLLRKTEIVIFLTPKIITGDIPSPLY